MKILLSLSGGMDSTTLLGHLLAQGHEVICVGFYYGSKHNKHENSCAIEVAEHYGVVLKWIDLSEVMRSFKSNLLMSGGEIPEGHYSDKTMSATVVPFRNGIFLSILAGLAESEGCDSIAVGIHQGDHAIYPDCRLEFFTYMSCAIKSGTDGKVDMIAPFLHLDKTGILKIGFDIDVPYNLTRTCYKDQPISCGKCGSCVERLEAFSNLQTIDPITYAN